MQVNVEKFKARAQKDLPRVILLEDADGYVLKSVIKTLRMRLFGGDGERSDSAEEVQLNAKELGVRAPMELIGQINTLPMFSTEKLVVLRQAEALRSQEEEILLKYFKEEFDVAGSAYVIIHYNKIRANAKMKKHLESIGLFVKQTTDRKPQFEAAVRNLAAEKGVKLSNDTVRFLLEYLPRNLTLLESEMEKLALFAGGSGAIALKDASQLVCSTNLENVFEMADHIGSKQPAKALAVLQSMLDSGQPPQMLLAMIARHMRHLYRIKKLSGYRVSRDLVLQGLGTKSAFVIDKATRQARGFGLNGLREAMKEIARVDVELKTSSTASEFLLERLVRNLCRLPAGDDAKRSFA